MRTFIREVLAVLITALVIFLVLNVVIAIPPSEVISGSMEPTLQVGQRLIISKVAYAFHEPGRGDIITFRLPSNPKATLIKRIIGLPGETVEVNNGAVYINGSKLDEPYITETIIYTFPPYKIPEENYFVLGDNRNNSSDSHTGWTASRSDIIGKAWVTIWPPGRWGLALNYTFPEGLSSSTG